MNIQQFLTLSEFRTQRPNLSIMTDTQIQEAINVSSDLLNSICNGLIQEVLDYSETPEDQKDANNPYYRTAFELEQIKKAFVFQTQYTINLGNDFTQGSSSFSTGGVSGSFQRPENRETIAPGAKEFLAKARVFSFMNSVQLSNNSLGCRNDGTTTPINWTTLDNKFLNKELAGQWYLARYQPNANVGAIPVVNQTKYLEFQDPSTLTWNATNANKVLDADGVYKPAYEMNNLAFFGPHAYNTMNREQIYKALWASAYWKPDISYPMGMIIRAYKPDSNEIGTFKSLQDNNLGHNPWDEYEQQTKVYWDPVGNVDKVDFDKLVDLVLNNADLTKKFTDIETKQQQQDTSIETNRLGIVENATNINSIVGEVARIDAKLAEVDTQQATQDTNITTNATNIASNTNEINTIKVEQATQNASITSNTNEINTLKTNCVTTTLENQKITSSKIFTKAPELRAVNRGVVALKMQMQWENGTKSWAPIAWYEGTRFLAGMFVHETAANHDALVFNGTGGFEFNAINHNIDFNAQSGGINLNVANNQNATTNAIPRVANSIATKAYVDEQVANAGAAQVNWSAIAAPTGVKFVMGKLTNGTSNFAEFHAVVNNIPTLVASIKDENGDLMFDAPKIMTRIIEPSFGAIEKLQIGGLGLTTQEVETTSLKTNSINVKDGSLISILNNTNIAGNIVCSGSISGDLSPASATNPTRNDGVANKQYVDNAKNELTATINTNYNKLNFTVLRNGTISQALYRSDLKFRELHFNDLNQFPTNIINQIKAGDLIIDYVVGTSTNLYCKVIYFYFMDSKIRVVILATEGDRDQFMVNSSIRVVFRRCRNLVSSF